MSGSQHPSRTAPLCCTCRHDVMGYCNHPSSPVDPSVGTPLWTHAYARSSPPLREPLRCGPEGRLHQPRERA